MAVSAPQTAAGCPTFQSYSDTNYPELDPIVFSIQSHEIASLQTPVTSLGAPGYPPFYLAWLQIQELSLTSSSPSGFLIC